MGDFGVYTPFIWGGYGVSIAGFSILILHTVWMRRKAILMVDHLQRHYDAARTSTTI